MANFVRFDFLSGDELFLEPMSGELKPNSHCNIKMTLLPGKYPCNFEGEIQCSIDWENEDKRAMDEARSVATNTNVPEVSEYLFIRLKKRAKIVSFSSTKLLRLTVDFLSLDQESLEIKSDLLFISELLQ